MADQNGIPGSPLGDLFAGASGANINRPALNSFVATSQQRNGLYSAQTQDALIKAQQQQESVDAYNNIPAALKDAFPGMRDSETQLARDFITRESNGDPITALKAIGTLKLGYGQPAEQTAGQQMVKGQEAGPVATPPNFQLPPGSPLANVPVQQSPEGAAQTAHLGAQTNLANAQATNPQMFHPGGMGSVPPEGQAALSKAIVEGRLDPTRVNSRSAPILAQMELSNPGTNYNRMHADAALQSNPTFQQANMSADMLPGVLAHMTTLGKKLNGGAGYSDLKSVGTMQKWLNGQTNDPDYTEYMTVRNDAMLRIAKVMRGVGMSDKATEMENEAAAPTLAPYALDSWLKGQMAVLNPLLERQNRIVHLGEKGQGTAPLNAPPAAAPAGGAAPQSLDDYLKAKGF